MRLRALSEAEAYARCYGEGDENVRFVRMEPRRPSLFYGVSGEDLRQAFETRLEGREHMHETVGETLVETAPEPAPVPTSNGHNPATAA